MFRSSQATVGKAELARTELGFCKLNGNLKTNICFGQSMTWKNARLQLTVRAVQSEAVRSDKVSGPARTCKQVRGFFSVFGVNFKFVFSEFRGNEKIVVGSIRTVRNFMIQVTINS